MGTDDIAPVATVVGDTAGIDVGMVAVAPPVSVVDDGGGVPTGAVNGTVVDAAVAPLPLLVLQETRDAVSASAPRGASLRPQRPHRPAIGDDATRRPVGDGERPVGSRTRQDLSHPGPTLAAMTSANQHVTVPAGRKGAIALRDVIARCKRDDLLAPVTVLVPSTLAGLSLRRLLASGGLDDPGDPVTGIANVGFTVVGRLLELLGAPTLTAEGRRRMDPAVRAEAVRAELLAEPGLFGPVARHPATERRLDATFTELRRADAPAIERLAEQSHRSAEIVRLLHAVEARLHGWFDDQDLLEPALATVRAGGQAVAELGHLVLYAGRSDDTEARALVEAFGDRGTVIDTTTDPAPVGTAVVSASDADDEVRRAVREVLRLVDAGTPLHRIAIAHPGAAYPLLIHQQLSSAGIPHNGQGVQTLAQTAAGRALLGAFGLVDHDFRRDDVLGWLASAPLLQSDGRWVPLARWDRLSRRAGVVGGVEQWTTRLSAKHLELTEEAAAIADDPEQTGRADRKRRDAESIGRLRDFVVRLADELTATDRVTWADHVRWASRLLLDLIGADAQRAAWPEAELKAADRVLDTLAGLASLDELGTPVDLPTFRRAVERDLDVPAARLGPFGDGVLVSSLRPLRGVDLDAVVVVGLAEGLAPMRSREDAMVPDRERTAAGESLRRPNRVLDQHEDLLAVLAAARGPRVLCFPRADLASGRHHLPSRWLLDTASALAGTRVYSDDLGDLPATVASIEEVPSFTAGLRQEPAVSLLDRDLGRLLEWQDGGGRAIDHPLATEEPAFGAGLHAIDERDSERFTAFDGNVDPAAVPQLAPDRPLSPTSLESYAACPRRYFFSRVLGLQEDERPEDLEQIAPAARGTLVHAVLEDYTRGLLAGQPRSIDRLLAIADDKFTEVEAQGITGRPLRWEWDQTVIEADLRRIHDEDVLEPVAAELAFGVGDEHPVEVVLDDGRQLTFKGYADRVDRAPDGTIVVTDYKTGSARHFKDLDKTFVDRGRKLQLPIYGLAARDRFGGEGQTVRSQYWFVSGRGGFQKIGYDLDEGLPTFLETVEVIADGIADGVFPASPGDVVDWPTPSWESCRYCDFNRICPSNRAEEWVRKREAPELWAYVTLAEPPVDEADGDGAGPEPAGPAAATSEGRPA